MSALIVRLAPLVAVILSGCTPVPALPPRPLAPARTGRLIVTRMAELKRTPEATGLCKDVLVDGDFVYAIFDGLPLTLLRWDLRNPSAEPDRLEPQGQMPDWGVRLAKRSGRVILVCGDPEHAKAGPKEIESVALMDGSRQQFEAALDDPYFACDQIIPHFILPHSSRVDLVVGILTDAGPRILARAKGADQNRMSLCRRVDGVRAAYTVDRWLEVVEVDSAGSTRTLRLGEPECREPRIVSHGNRWLVAYVQNYKSLCIRFDGDDASVARRCETEVSHYAVLSTGHQLLVLVSLYRGGTALLRLDEDGTWRESTSADTFIREPFLFVRDGTVHCVAMERSKALGMYRVETDD